MCFECKCPSVHQKKMSPLSGCLSVLETISQASVLVPLGIFVLLFALALLFMDAVIPCFFCRDLRASAIHEVGHLLAAKSLGYEAVIRINSVSITGGAASVRDAAIIDGAGPLVTVLLAAGGLAISERHRIFGPTIVFAALAMRILATVVSTQLPNDEARIGNALDIGTWTLPALVVGVLAVLMIASARRSGVGLGWLLSVCIGASIGFVIVVFGEPYLPAMTL